MAQKNHDLIPMQLSALELRILRDSLHAHLAGDPREGDLSWTEYEIAMADTLVHKLTKALPSPRKASIRVGQRLIRWDGVKGYVDLDSLGKRVYGPDEHFKIVWEDGDILTLTLRHFVDEGIQRGNGVMAWAR